MNKKIVSRESILIAAIAILEKEGDDALQIRSVAGACGVAIGSVYNYFPSKSALMIAVVEHIWSSIFHPQLCTPPPSHSFVLMLHTLYAQVAHAAKKHHNFFALHHKLIDKEGKSQGSAKMHHYFMHMKEGLLSELLADPNVNNAIWTENFTPSQLVDFTFSSMFLSLSQEEENCEFLLQLLKKLLYTQ